MNDHCGLCKTLKHYGTSKYLGHCAYKVIRDHLYKKHRKPTHCLRCCEKFENESELKDHQQTEKSCTARQYEEPDGFDKDQEDRIRSRKDRKNETQENLWTRIYRILFPNDVDIPTPCKGFNTED